MSGFGWDEADLRALEALRPLTGSGAYLPWSDWALRPAALAAICNEIVIADRREVVELGSGISSVVLGRLLAQRGGRLTSVEHDAAWSGVVQGLLETDGRGDVVRLIEAPLEPHPLAPDDAPWYSEAALAALPDDIELLVVDGPPGNDEGIERSRFPALPVLDPRLTAEGIVVLDDAGRPGERAILERWGAEHPEWRFTTRDEGIAIGVRAA